MWMLTGCAYHRNPWLLLWTAKHWLQVCLINIHHWSWTEKEIFFSNIYLEQNGVLIYYTETGCQSNTVFFYATMLISHAGIKRCTGIISVYWNMKHLMEMLEYNNAAVSLFCESGFLLHYHGTPEVILFLPAILPSTLGWWSIEPRVTIIPLVPFQMLEMQKVNCNISRWTTWLKGETGVDLH